MKPKKISHKEYSDRYWKIVLGAGRRELFERLLSDEEERLANSREDSAYYKKQAALSYNDKNEKAVYREEVRYRKKMIEDSLHIIEALKVLLKCV